MNNWEKLSSGDKYKYCVEQAKDLLKVVECYQATIAYFAVKVCEIRHGGRSNEIYTIKRFASDIGKSHKTVQEWSRVYRGVIAKLNMDVKDITKEDWKAANRVMLLITREKTTMNEISGNAGKMNANHIELSNEQVRELFEEAKLGRSNQLVMAGFRDSIVYIRNKIYDFNCESVSLSLMISLHDNLIQTADLLMRKINEKSSTVKRKEYKLETMN